MNTIEPTELAKFAKISHEWWDPQGAVKTLHHLNPLRLSYIKTHVSLNNQKVLDLGCGGGLLSEAMAKEGALVTGLDAEKTLIEVASLHAAKAKLSIDYVCQAVENYEGGPFDVITCMEMLEHVDSVETIIQYCASLMVPKGFLFLSTLNRTVQSYLTAILGAEYVLQLLPKQTHDYQKFIKPHELAAVLRQSGFELLDITGVGYNPLTEKAYLQESVQVNYMMVCQAI